MFAPYRAVLALPGARTLTLACAVAWLTYSAYGLGLVLLVEHATGSFAHAGAVAAAFSLGSALVAPLRGRAVDRHGRRALTALAVVHSLALAALLALVTLGAPSATSLAAAALAGAAAPPLIAVARSRWTGIAGPGDAVRTAHAMNAVLGDIGQVVGPLAVAATATIASPTIALVLLLPGVLVATAILAAPAAQAHRLGELCAVPNDRLPHRARAGFPGGRGLAALLAVETLLAVAFGALDVAAPALGAAQASAPAGALVLAVFALASAAAGVWSGAATAVAPPRSRLIVGLLVTAACLALAALAPSLLAVGLAAVPAGAGVGLAFVAVMELLDHLVEAHRAVEAFTWLTAGGGAGGAAGAAAAGFLAQQDHLGGALALAAAAATLAGASGLAIPAAAAPPQPAR